MSIQLQAESTALCTLSLSFNDEGPLGSIMRYICDRGTFSALRESLHGGFGRQIEMGKYERAGTGIEQQDRNFISSIIGVREPLASIEGTFECYCVISDFCDDLERRYSCV